MQSEVALYYFLCGTARTSFMRAEGQRRHTHE
jgi:hypothetical protein